TRKHPTARGREPLTTGCRTCSRIAGREDLVESPMMRTRTFALILSLALSVAWRSSASAATCDSPAPEWLACEDFEDGALGWEAWFAQSPWVECNGCSSGTNNPDRIQLLNDASAAHSGNW